MAVQYVKVRTEFPPSAPVTRPTGALAIVGAATTGTENEAVPVATAGDVEKAFGDADASVLSRALVTALRQTPGPSQVFGVRSGTDLGQALDAVELLDVQFVVLADTPLDTASGAEGGAVRALVDHVTTVSTVGDGKERMGVAMLAPDSTDVSVLSGALASNRMVYVAHRSTDDVAAAVAGTIAGYPPHVSMVLKQVAVDSEPFTAAQIDSLNLLEEFEVGPQGQGVTWLLSRPPLLPGRGVYLGEGYNGNAGGMKYIDVQRTIDDVSFKLKARLIRSVGSLRISRSGLRSLEVQLATVLDRLVADGVIEGYAIAIPVLDLLDADPATLTEAQRTEIDDAQLARLARVSVDVDYAGAMHRIAVDMSFR